MLTAKTNRSSLSDAHNGKNTQTTPRISKLVRGGSTKSASGSPVLLRSFTSCVDGSPKSIDSRPPTAHRSAKIILSADKLPRPTKTPTLQPRLDVLQEELRRTREQLASVEQEKLKAVKELDNANRTADESYCKLNEALAARSMAEESSKIARVRADKIQQAGIEAARKKEEECQNEIDRVRNRHDLDVLSLLSTTKELERVRQELTLTSDSRDRAICHSNDARKIAEINAEKVDILSSEVNQLNALLDSTMDSLSNENQEIVKKMNLEIDCLKSKLEKTKLTDVKLVEMELLLEVLNTELNVAKRGEFDACKFVDELKKQVELLLVQLQEAKLSQKSSTDLSYLVSKQLNDWKVALLDSESELAALREKVNTLGFEVVQHKEELLNSEKLLREAHIEASKTEETVVVLKSELQNLKQEKLLATENEKIVASKIESLSEEKIKLMRELETARYESENNKKDMEELASALRKVSLEARETREILLEKHTEIEDFYAQTEHLRSALKNTEESYQVMLDEARYEIICLKKSIERNQTEAESVEAEWNVKELNVSSSIDSTKEESESKSWKGAHYQVNAKKDDKYLMLNKVIDSESATAGNGVAEDAKADPFSFKESSLNVGNELQNVRSENSTIPARETAGIDKIKELSIFLAKPKATKPKDSVLSKCDNEYEVLDTNANYGERKKASSGMQGYLGQVKEENANRIRTAKVDTLKMGSKLPFSAYECDVKSIDDELDSRMASRSFRKVNILPSEDFNGDSLKLIRFQEVKVKKALLNKLGNLLKRSNHK
ncbi:WEB family protein At3g02930, chloroplastic isoform X1 [Dendrobium catenatum]|uniref:WEB family protein At3g02930, chloroplastic isoform X1 n=1 Tax=Dendrobium catenatum TaxID=906689 RepID=UPI0009F6DE86|nr:WEB family protein At3g02930, chloroplastic isoform X1 [Dendrobium catenatum]